jgi:hypothetical protein
MEFLKDKPNSNESVRIFQLFDDEKDCLVISEAKNTVCTGCTFLCHEKT